MHDLILKSGRDTLLVAIPFIAMLFIGLFRLDELIFKPKKSCNQQRPPRGVDKDGRTIFCDPNSKPR
jgi:hypothetical protein